MSLIAECVHKYIQVPLGRLPVSVVQLWLLPLQLPRQAEQTSCCPIWAEVVMQAASNGMEQLVGQLRHLFACSLSLDAGCRLVEDSFNW